MRPAAAVTSIAVFGCGAVGLAAVMAARTMGCATIIALDRVPARLALARELGATHTIDVTAGQAVAEIRGIMPGGVHFAVETSGVPAVATDAVTSLRCGGQCGLLGVGPADARLTLSHPMVALYGVGTRGYRWLTKVVGIFD